MMRNKLRSMGWVLTGLAIAASCALAQIRDPLEVQKGRDAKLQKRGSVSYYSERWDLSDLPAYQAQQSVSG